MPVLTPSSRAEEIALFRHQLIAPLVLSDASHGELRARLVEISQQRVRPPRADATRTYSIATLERWYYAFRQHGLEALRPSPRGDRGRARVLTPDQRALLLDIRREHPNASAALILRTLIADGRLTQGAVSVVTLRRLYREHRLDRATLLRKDRGKTRLRWEAARPNALWHGDVCHAAPILVAGTRLPVRIHALLDDTSRFLVAIEVQHTEREVDMLAMLVDALRRRGVPDALYLDNGSTYSGDTLRVACSRLGISLLHARPYDPEARGKMERFWRTLRQGCLDHLGTVASLHDIHVRILAFVDQHYHRAPHAGLMGRTPGDVWTEGLTQRAPDVLDETKLRDALTVRSRRRVRRDSTLSLEGIEWQVAAGFLAGQLVTVAHVPIERPLRPWIEHDDQVYTLEVVDPRANARTPRLHAPPQCEGPPRDFDPAGALLDLQLGRGPRGGES